MKTNTTLQRGIIYTLLFGLLIPLIPTIEILLFYNSMPSGVYTYYPNVVIDNGTIRAKTKTVDVPWVARVPTNQLLACAISKGVWVDAFSNVYGKIPVTYPREKMSLAYRYDLIDLSALIISIDPSLLIDSGEMIGDEIRVFERAVEASKRGIKPDSKGRVTLSEFSDLQRHGFFLIWLQQAKQHKMPSQGQPCK